MTVRIRRHRRAEAPARYDADTAAAQLEVYLQAGGSLRPVQLDDLALDQGEVAFADVRCTMARYYATTVTYPKAPAGYYEDHPAFGRRWVPNHRLDARRRRAAEVEAQERWRDHAGARLVLTSEGLRINPLDAPGTWLPFDHALLTHIAAAPARRELVLSYSVCEPLLLSGNVVPWLSVALHSLLPSELIAPFTENRK
ncbi:hypothetical protein [Streptomyces cinereoruber]|uniref:hypothetical protein n=1 Tax=Streptomyces cinereoruber TaxID=67260 RepID=UPI003624DB06